MLAPACTGEQTRAGATYSYYFTPAFVVTTQGYAQRENAEVGYYKDWEIALSGGFAWTFDNPLWQERFAARVHANSTPRIDAGHQVMNTRPQALAEILLVEATS